MELIGNLKDKVEKAQSKKEAQNIIENAGMRLTEDEMDMVAGGKMYTDGPQTRGFEAEQNMRDPYIPVSVTW